MNENYGLFLGLNCATFPFWIMYLQNADMNSILFDLLTVVLFASLIPLLTELKNSIKEFDIVLENTI